MSARTRFLSALVPADEDKMRIARLLDVILLAFLAMTVLYGALSLILVAVPYPVLMIVGMLILLASCGLLLNRRGHVHLASVLLLASLWATITLGTFGFGGVSGPGLSGYIVFILMAGLLLGGGAGLVSAGFSLVGGLGILFAEIAGALPPSIVPITPEYTWIVVTATLIMSAVLLYLATRSISEPWSGLAAMSAPWSKPMASCSARSPSASGRRPPWRWNGPAWPSAWWSGRRR